MVLKHLNIKVLGLFVFWNSKHLLKQKDQKSDGRAVKKQLVFV